MYDLLGQLPALVGVAVGAVASYLVATATERRRWRRGLETRWDEHRLAAYVEYGSAVKAIFDRVLRLRDDNQKEFIDRAAVLQELRPAGAERAAKWEQVLLLGTPTSIAAARSWHQSVWALQDFVFGLRSGDQEWETALRRSAVARTAFYIAARKDLGLRDPDLPEEPDVGLLVRALKEGGLPETRPSTEALGRA